VRQIFESVGCGGNDSACVVWKGLAYGYFVNFFRSRFMIIISMQ